MNAYECSALELAMRYLDVAHAQLLLDEMDGVPGIHDARRALATAEEQVAKAYQAQTETQAVVQSASSEAMLCGSRLKPNARPVSQRKAIPRAAERAVMSV
jgi:hypothetical protein